MLLEPSKSLLAALFKHVVEKEQGEEEVPDA